MFDHNSKPLARLICLKLKLKTVSAFLTLKKSFSETIVLKTIVFSTSTIWLLSEKDSSQSTEHFSNADLFNFEQYLKNDLNI